jgi:hypothetical protein
MPSKEFHWECDPHPAQLPEWQEPQPLVAGCSKLPARPNTENVFSTCGLPQAEQATSLRSLSLRINSSNRLSQRAQMNS